MTAADWEANFHRVSTHLRHCITEKARLHQERDEARAVARKILHIARAHGAKPFGLSMAPWLEETE